MNAKTTKKFQLDKNKEIYMQNINKRSEIQMKQKNKDKIRELIENNDKYA